MFLTTDFQMREEPNYKEKENCYFAFITTNALLDYQKLIVAIIKQNK